MTSSINSLTLLMSHLVKDDGDQGFKLENIIYVAYRFNILFSVLFILMI